MKKCSVTALALLITGCAQQTFTVQCGSSSTKRKPSPIISSFLELGRRKTVDAAKICGGAEKMLLKQKPSKHS